MDKKSEYQFVPGAYVIDRKLYKYFSRAQYAIDCIRNRRIHLDDPKGFNDPFDAVSHCPQYSMLTTFDSDRKVAERISQELVFASKASKINQYQIILKEYIDFFIKRSMFLPPNEVGERPVKTVLQKIYSMINSKSFSLSEFIEAVDRAFIERNRVIRVNCKISCFTEICDSILMWSYYANSHQGICVEFDLSLLDMKDELTRNIVNSISRVHYSPIRADILTPIKDTSALNFLITKADVWAHEHEWRLICETEEEYLPFDCISGVYVGVNFDTSAAKYKDLIKAVNTHEHLAVRKCELNLERYQIDSTEIYNSTFHTLFTEKEKTEHAASLA